MSLVFAALTPHPPLLLPSIGQEASKKVEQTRQALAKLEEELYLSKAEVIIVFSSHGTLLPDTFSVNVAAEYHSDLRQFGDLSTVVKFKGELGMLSRLRQTAEDSHLKTMMTTEAKLDYGTAIPLIFLTKHLPDVAVIPIGCCSQADDLKLHFDFGSILKEQISATTKRVAVIASGDLSHALTTDAPAGFNPRGPEFDDTIKKLLSAQNTSGLMQLPSGLAHDAAECGLRCIMMLLGVLRGTKYRYEEYSYEAPFGVGYLTANFIL